MFPSTAMNRCCTSREDGGSWKDFQTWVPPHSIDIYNLVRNYQRNLFPSEEYIKVQIGSCIADTSRLSAK